MALHIGQYWDVLRALQEAVLKKSCFNVLGTSVQEILRTSLGNVPWHYIEDDIGTSVEHLLGTSLGRLWDVVFPQ